MARQLSHFSRRNVLKAAGAMLALPWLESLSSSRVLGAAAASGPPLRMGIFTVTGGTVLESWVPKQTGALGKLPSILRPLEFAKQDVLIASGLSQGGRCDGVNAHEHCAFKHLTGAEFVKREGGKAYAAVSVDQAAAQAVGDDTFLPSLELGLTSNQYSFRSPEIAVPFEGNPRLVFDRMFRGRKPVAPNWQNRRSAPIGPAKTAPSDSDDRSVIDLVLGQAKDLNGQLGRDDRQKLDGYLDSVRSVEKRIAFIESRHTQELADLASPGPSRLNIPADLPRDNDDFMRRIRRPIDNDPAHHGDYIRLLSDLMVLAFQTDTTRVVTLAAGSDDAMFPGVVTVGYERHCHTLEHQGNAGKPEDADPIAREACRQVHAWYTSLFAETIRKMQGVDEGNGTTLLDNTMLLYTSYMADGGHGQREYPVALVGKAKGTIKGGRHVRFEQNAPVSNLYVEMLNRMGAKTDTFGDSKTSQYAGSLNGRLPGLL